MNYDDHTPGGHATRSLLIRPRGRATGLPVEVGITPTEQRDLDERGQR